MKFRYLGDNDNMIAFGHDFSDGQTPDVTDENAIKRLSGNRFFEAIDGELEPEPEPEPESEPEPEPVKATFGSNAKTGKAAVVEVVEEPANIDADADFPALPGDK